MTLAAEGQTKGKHVCAVTQTRRVNVGCHRHQFGAQGKCQRDTPSEHRARITNITGMMKEREREEFNFFC